MNKGLTTELTHFGILTEVFKDFAVSNPKGFAGGSDFTAAHPEFGMVTFESKSSNTDIFDAGVVTVCSEANITSLSKFYTNTHCQALQNIFLSNVPQIREHCELAGVSCTTYTTTKDHYECIKAEGKLINIKAEVPPDLIAATLTHGDPPKANYVVVGDLIYLASPDPQFDPLHLVELGVPALHESDIKSFEIRTRRGGSRGPAQKVSVGIRMGYKFASRLTPTPLKLDLDLHQIIRAQLRKHF